MGRSRKQGEYEEPNKHDRFLLFLAFLLTALVGYVLTNHIALLGA